MPKSSLAALQGMAVEERIYPILICSNAGNLIRISGFTKGLFCRKINNWVRSPRRALTRANAHEAELSSNEDALLRSDWP